jgi:hypothetical protein
MTLSHAPSAAPPRALFGRKSSIFVTSPSGSSCEKTNMRSRENSPMNVLASQYAGNFVGDSFSSS